MKFDKRIITLLIIFFIVGIVANAVYAHRMLIEKPQPGEVEVSFDDGEAAKEVEVTLYNQDEAVLKEGLTDKKGILNYDSSLEPYKIVAEDDMGHRAVWIDGELEEGFLAGVPLWQRALLGVGGLLILAGGATVIKNKK